MTAAQFARYAFAVLALAILAAVALGFAAIFAIPH